MCTNMAAANPPQSMAAKSPGPSMAPAALPPAGPPQAGAQSPPAPAGPPQGGQSDPVLMALLQGLELLIARTVESAPASAPPGQPVPQA